MGGAGVYYVVSHQHMALAMQAERALAEESLARMEAERARADAQAATAAGTASKDRKPVADPNDSPYSAAESVLRAQEEAWNRSDLDAFMAHYWKSDKLTFSSEGKTTRGWTATLNRYRDGIQRQQR
jgi:hypothetical protein